MRWLNRFILARGGDGWPLVGKISTPVHAIHRLRRELRRPASPSLQHLVKQRDRNARAVQPMGYQVRSLRIDVESLAVEMQLAVTGEDLPAKLRSVQPDRSRQVGS